MEREKFLSDVEKNEKWCQSFAILDSFFCNYTINCWIIIKIGIKYLSEVIFMMIIIFVIFHLILNHLMRTTWVHSAGEYPLTLLFCSFDRILDRSLSVIIFHSCIHSFISNDNNYVQYIPMNISKAKLSLMQRCNASKCRP